MEHFKEKIEKSGDWVIYACAFLLIVTVLTIGVVLYSSLGLTPRVSGIIMLALLVFIEGVGPVVKEFKKRWLAIKGEE